MSHLVVNVSFATALTTWAAGGWLLLWVTTRRREVGLGYGWLLRGVFLFLSISALILVVIDDSAGVGSADVEPADVGAAEVGPVGVVEPVGVETYGGKFNSVALGFFVCAGLVALSVSVRRRRAGVAGQRAVAEHRAKRVRAMIDRGKADHDNPTQDNPATKETQAKPTLVETDHDNLTTVEAEFPPVLDLIAALVGLLVAVMLGLSSMVAGGSATFVILRTVVGAVFLGAVTDAMLLGHWYLVQPGLPRAPLLQLVKITVFLWFPETLVMLSPKGMVSVLNGSIDDGYNGLLGWFWVACTLATLGLVLAAFFALRERQYSAVMAATGLIYLAILTAFGQDLIPRILAVV